MKFFPFLILAASCKPVPPAATTGKTPAAETLKPVTEMQTGYKTLKSIADTYVLYYRVAEEKNSPVRRIEYYVTESKTGKTVRNKQTVAAEKIYWKDDSSLAIIPYTEVARQAELGKEQENSEIIIKIK